MKTCTKCKMLLNFSLFSKNKASRDGYNYRCKACIKAYDEANREKISAIKKRYRDENKEKIASTISKWRKRNKEKSRAYTAKYRQKIGSEQVLEMAKRYREANREKTRAAALRWQKQNRATASATQMKRHASKLQATPKWADFEKIEEFYKEAERLSKIHSRHYHVDHVVPLRSKIVCGLHWEGNLQVIPADENRRKGNRHWPDMP